MQKHNSRSKPTKITSLGNSLPQVLRILVFHRTYPYVDHSPFLLYKVQNQQFSRIPHCPATNYLISNPWSRKKSKKDAKIFLTRSKTVAKNININRIMLYRIHRSKQTRHNLQHSQSNLHAVHISIWVNKSCELSTYLYTISWSCRNCKPNTTQPA